MDACAGKQYCALDVPIDVFARISPSAQKLNMMVFAQVACTQSADYFDTKNALAYVSASIGIVMMAIFSVAIRKMIREDKLNDKILDMQLVTVDDYTTQTRLDPKIFDDFKKSLPHDDKQTAPIMKFKLRLIDQISSQLHIEKTDIVDIHFGFNNSRMLNKVEERANALKSANFQKVVAIQKEMN